MTTNWKRQSYKRMSDAEVIDIRQRSERGEINASIARTYGVSDAVIGNIVNRKCYKTVRSAPLVAPVVPVLDELNVIPYTPVKPKKRKRRRRRSGLRGRITRAAGRLMTGAC